MLFAFGYYFSLKYEFPSLLNVEYGIILVEISQKKKDLEVEIGEKEELDNEHKPSHFVVRLVVSGIRTLLVAFWAAGLWITPSPSSPPSCGQSVPGRTSCTTSGTQHCLVGWGRGLGDRIMCG